MSAPTLPPGFHFDLLGGRLCLDFVNTVSGKRVLDPVERLREYADLVLWAEQVEVLDAAGARALLRRARAAPGEAQATLAEAHALREALFRLFVALSEGKPGTPEDLAVVDAQRAAALPHQHLVQGPGGVALAWEPPGEHLAAPLWPVALSAGELLTAPEERARVRLCEATHEDGCGWVFLDETKNRRRRWCSMKDCGNRAKARRHYARQQQQG
jgi:predicted RNA-binding Zn ribbon-like protein